MNSTDRIAIARSFEALHGLPAGTVCYMQDVFGGGYRFCDVHGTILGYIETPWQTP